MRARAKARVPVLPRLPAALARRLALARSIARRERMRLFLVGGSVRDWLLGLPVRDIDLAVEGDAVLLARRVAEALGSAARVHGRFGTATVETARAERFDFAATRRETYERPGALPTVSAAPIEEDLFRRDFTVNAMALEIAPRRRARLLDLFGGRADLSRRLLRILHPASFQDDPTRAYRAARYANRLGFSVERSTRRAAREAVARGVFDAISGDRRRQELRLLFSEADRAAAVRWMARLDLVRTVHSALDTGAATLRRLRAAEALARGRSGDTMWILYVLVWAARLGPEQAEALAVRLALSGESGRALRAWPGTLRLLSRLSPARPSALAGLGLSAEEALAAAVCCRGGRLRNLLLESLARAPLELTIRGRDLLRAGIVPGPAVGRALQKTLAARRDGKISRKGELDFALKAAREESS